jgi:hypothetical protein
MKIIYTGIESSGKSLLLSKQAEKVRQRNIKWFKVTGLKRTMAFNSPMSQDFIQLVKNSNINYLEFKNLDEILYLEEADIFIDEVIKYFPASGSNSLSNEQLHFITQGAKSGIHLWGASQDFSQVHKQFRLLVNQVYVITKLIGSERPMKTAPPVKYIWGICTKRRVNPLSFKGDSATMEQLEGGLSIFFIKKIDIARFDTSYKIPITKLPIKKIRRQEEYCDEDGFKRIRYI